MTKLAFKNKEAKSVFKMFGLISIVFLFSALGLVTYHGLTNVGSVIPEGDVILILFGLVTFTLGVSLANSYEIQNSREVKHDN